MALQRAVAQDIPCPTYDSADHVTPATPTSPVVRISKDGAPLASPAGAVTVITGWGVHIAFTAADMDAESIAVEVASGNCDTAAFVVLTEADWTAVRAGKLDTIAADVWTYTTRTLTSFGTLVAAIAAAVWTYVTRTLTDWGTLPEDLDDQLSGTHGDGSWEAGGSGTGTFPITLTVEDNNGDPVAGARVTVAGLSPQTSDANGAFPTAWALDAGTYSFTTQTASRYTPTNPGTLTVDATGAVTVPAGGVIVVQVASLGTAACMNFGQLCGQVQTALAEWLLSHESLRPVFPELVEQWVQQAIYRLDADIMWTQEREQITSVADQRRYDMETFVLQVQQVTYDGTELSPLTTPEEIARHEVDTSSGTPAYYSWYGQELALYPIPDTSGKEIEVWTVRTPEAMAENADVPALPCHMSVLLIDYALYQGFRHVGEMERSQECLKMYLAAMESERSNCINTRGVLAARRDSRVV